MGRTGALWGRLASGWGLVVSRRSLYLGIVPIGLVAISQLDLDICELNRVAWLHSRSTDLAIVDEGAGAAAEVLDRDPFGRPPQLAVASTYLGILDHHVAVSVSTYDDLRMLPIEACVDLLTFMGANEMHSVELPSGNG
jgi:hypothetical protein